MSSTNRGRKRNRQDNYPSPKWCAKRLLEGVTLPQGMWLEPCAGDGAIIAAIHEALGPNDNITWHAIEIRKEPMAKLGALEAKVHVYNRDAFGLVPRIAPFDVTITNPPFSKAMAFIEMCRKHSTHVLMLLRLNFLGSEERAEFMRETKPDIYVLPNRPSFFRKRVLNKKTGELSKRPRDVTDSIEYAWFHWWPGATGKYVVLASTPPHERLLSRRRARP